MSRINRSILITGGCGFVGLNLIGYLLKQGIERIRILDNLSVGTRDDLEKYLKERGNLTLQDESEAQMDYVWTPEGSSEEACHVTLLVEDIRDRERMFDVVGDDEAIVHLAAQTGVVESVEDPFFDFEHNVLGILNMLQSAVKHSCPAFVFASSAAPMGDQPPPNREDVAPRPLSPYGATKLAGEGYCSAFGGSFNLPVCSLRFSNVYGPYSTFKSSVIAKFFRSALLGENLVIFGDGNQTRDFVHTHDLAQAIFRALTGLMERPGNSATGEIFQIATGRETSINDLFGMIKELMERDTGKEVKLHYTDPRPGEIYRNYADITKARNVLKYQPEVDIDKGLNETWEWFKTKF